MKARKTVTVVSAIVLAASLALAAATTGKLDQLQTGAGVQEVLFIPSPAVLKRMSLGYTGLLADIYWTRVVQYFGGRHHEHAMQYKLLDPLLQITTALDPHLIVAYEFGSIFLAQQPPEGAGDPDAAVRLVERGIAANPDAWRLYYHLGFIQYLERHDYRAATDAFERGSKIPGAHPWMKIMAATMAQNGGDAQTARFLWTKIYESTDDPLIRANAIKRLRALRVDEEVSYLERLVSAYRERSGQLPESWGALISSGQLRGVPLDPLGRPYHLLPDGRVAVQSAADLPFIHEGVPGGKEPSK
jgi:hypothetical protein